MFLRGKEVEHQTTGNKNTTYMMHSYQPVKTKTQRNATNRECQYFEEYFPISFRFLMFSQ